MTGILNILAGALGRVTDSFFEYVTLLLPGNGTDGANNNTFLDSGTANGGVGFTITRNGNTTQGTFSPFSQTGWGNYFPGSSSIQIASNSAFNINTYDTLECWVNFSSLGTNNLLVGRESNYWIGYNHTSIGGSANKIVFAIYNGTSWQAVSSSTTPSVGVWYHILGVKDNTTLRMYVNGVQENTATFSGSPTNTADSVFFGGKNTVESTICYISNARLITGASNTIFPYSGLTTGASFNSPTTPLTNVSGTSFLTCQSNRFKDNSSNTFTITVNGSPSVVAFSPFNPSASWSAATYGGSGYFDGSGDYLTWTGTSVGSGAFTFECWFYYTGTFAGTAAFIGPGTATTDALSIAISNSTTIQVDQYGVTATSFTVPTMTANQWYHLAVVRNSGGSCTVFLNGTRSSTGAVSITTNFANVAAIGYVSSAVPRQWIGYLAGVTYNSTALYDPTSSNITIPTSPTTAVSGTQLLLNFTNAGIYDATSKNDLETVGDAQISNTTAKFGSTSIKFDGTGDYLISPSSDLYNLGAGDFTVEGWVYTAASVANATIIDKSNNGGGATGWFLEWSSTRGLAFYDGSSATSRAYTVTNGQWYHIAVTRSGTNLRFFVDGTLQGAAATNSANITSTYRLSVGATNGTYQFQFNGYMQDIRITKGYARYTANFTPPTAAFPTL